MAMVADSAAEVAVWVLTMNGQSEVHGIKSPSS